MQLAEALFTPTFEQGERVPHGRDEYWYRRGLEQVVPVLAERRAGEFLPKLCCWLQASIEARPNTYPDRRSGHDESSWWRPAIEEHEQNREHDFTGAMAGFARKGFEAAIHSRALSLDEGIGILDGFPYLVFKRLRLHLIREFARQNPELARQVILTRELLDDYHCKHEYALLVESQFHLLLPEEQEQWLAWIDAGPEVADDEVPADDNREDDAGERERQDRVPGWRFVRLHWVRAHLKGERRRFYEEMVRQHGEPELAYFNVLVSSGFVRQESPIPKEQLAVMTFQQAAEAVSKWRPEASRFEGPSLEVLASTFEQYIATNPEQFSTQAAVLRGRPAIFVRWFISRMCQAVKTGREIDLRAVLDLCDWVVGRPVEERTTPVQEPGQLLDKDWQWTRDEISRFVKAVCEADTQGGPRYPLDEFRERIWSVIRSLCHDREDSYLGRDITAEDPRLCDYLDLAINSPRGKAVEAALAYARWVANHLKQVMPEVREMLDWQIATDNRSVGAMAVIGAHAQLIYLIDSQWLRENVDRLFRLEQNQQGSLDACDWAAWNAFLNWCRPHIEFFRLFMRQFASAVEHAAEVQPGEDARESPMHRLAEHLMVLYGRGQLGLDEPGGLLRRFLETAHPDIRRHGIGFVGRSLEQEQEVPADVIDRFRKLWDVYWEGQGRSDARGAPDAWLFGQWFLCRKFPDEWALERLERFVQVNATPEPSHAIAGRRQVSAHPRYDTARCSREVATPRMARLRHADS